MELCSGPLCWYWIFSNSLRRPASKERYVVQDPGRILQVPDGHLTCFVFRVYLAFATVTDKVASHFLELTSHDDLCSSRSIVSHR